jgi:hypothetical protein
MIRKLTLTCAALFFSALTASAQFCGFDRQHEKMLLRDPGYAQRILDDNTRYANAIRYANNSLVSIVGADTTYEIPVVIHVMNPGTGAPGTIYNPSDAQLIGMISYLNQSFAAQYPAYPDTANGGTNVPIRFVLAKRSPTCTPTNGILRYQLDTNAAYVANGVNVNNSNGIDDDILKDHQRWPVNDYYNIYIVNKLDGQDGTSGTFTAGFAYRPPVSERFDGTVMLATKAIAGQITLPHEIGHAMNLLHVFQGGTTTVCPTETNCFTQNDLVCDTEPIRRSNFNCPSGINPCTNDAYQNTQHNFMDYSDCQDRFTDGQRARMIDALKIYRGGLLSSLGGTALPASGTMASACIPTTNIPFNNINAGPRRVVLNDMTGVTSGGYNSDGNLVYIDRTCIQQANLNAGQTYTITVTTGNNENLRVFIDYNNDGLFTTTPRNEQVVARQGSGAQTATFTVPATGVVTCTPLRMRVVSDLVGPTLPTFCGPLTSGQAEDYSVVIKGPSNSASVAVALTAGTNPSCINSPLTFTATPGGTPGTGFTFKWYINGTATGITGNTFTTSTPVNGNVVTARIFYSGPCGADSSLSNFFLVQRTTAITPTVSAALTSGSNPGCAGQALTFTATATNGGTTPIYTWTRNGSTIPGATGNTFTTTTLNNGDLIRAVLASSLTCADPAVVTSAPITISFSPIEAAIAISQLSGTNPSCAGKPVTYQLISANGGTAPVYSWLINGSAVPGANGTSFTTSTLSNGDRVQAQLISNNPCVAQPVAVSNTINMEVTPSDTVSVATEISKGLNPGCMDSLLEFSAVTTTVNPASFTWYLNGTPVSNTGTYGSTSFSTGDQVYVRMVAGPGCHVQDTVYSQVTNISRTTAPAAPVISFIGNMLVSNISPVQWFGPSGLIPGATAQSYHPGGPGVYYARTNNNGCLSVPSNTLQVSLLTIGTYNLDAVQIYPNPTNGNLILDWGTTKVNVSINIFTATGQRVLQQEVKNATRQTMDVSSLASGIYFVMIRDEAGKTGTVRITVAK